MKQVRKTSGGDKPTRFPVGAQTAQYELSPHGIKGHAGSTAHQTLPTLTCRNVRPASCSPCQLSFHCPEKAILRPGLRPTDPCATAVGRESCSTPVINHREKFYTRLNNCYCNQDLHKTQFSITLLWSTSAWQDVIPLLVPGPAITTWQMA